MGELSISLRTSGFSEMCRDLRVSPDLYLLQCCGECLAGSLCPYGVSASLLCFFSLSLSPDPCLSPQISVLECKIDRLEKDKHAMGNLLVTRREDYERKEQDSDTLIEELGDKVRGGVGWVGWGEEGLGGVRRGWWGGMGVVGRVGWARTGRARWSGTGGRRGGDRDGKELESGRVRSGR